MNNILRIIRVSGWYGWMIVGALAVGGLVVLVHAGFPAASTQTVAAVGAFAVTGLLAFILL